MAKNAFTKLISTINKRAQALDFEEKLEDLKELLSDRGLYPKKEEKKTNPFVIILAVIGAIAAVAAVAYAVYYFLIPEDSEYFEDFEDFDDDDEFFDEDDDLEGDE